MRKLTVWTLLLAVLCAFVLPARAQEAGTPIATRQELEAIADNPGGSYRLTADIDLGGGDWVPIPFSGTLDGEGHTLYNLRIRQVGEQRGETVDGNVNRYDTAFGALFSVVEGAELRNLNILGADVQLQSEEHCFAAILAGSATDTVIENCSVEGRVRLYTTAKMVGVAGLVGFGHGQIQNCTADVELVFADRSDRSRTDQRCEQFLGGLVGTGVFDLYDNTVNLRGYDSCFGYVHNGGLNGMHFIYTGVPNREICGNQVTGSITFFENNPQRRAYCAAYVGEILPKPKKMQNNSQDFQRIELDRTRTEEILPHSCQDPWETVTVVPHTDHDFGYTLHRCETCGYSFRDSYVAPGHVPGDWVTETEPGYGQEGLKTRSCTVCGQVLESEVLPARIPAEAVSLSQENLLLSYKDTARLTAKVLPEDAADKGLVWSSSDPEIAAVDENGTVTAAGRGQAVITCRSADGYAESRCTVTVNYTPGQWLIQILLFGWLWY